MTTNGFSVALAFAALLLAGSVTAQGAVGVDAREHEAYGAYVSDANGQSLYVHVDDERGEASACGVECASVWPPLTVDDSVTFGNGVSLDLLGTIEREDGSRQLTYDGYPLYRFVEDEEPGDVRGHGSEGSWFLIGVDGERHEVADEEPADDVHADDADGAAGTVDPERMRAGGNVFQGHCAECHGDSGGGGIGTRLVGNDSLANTETIARKVVRGAGYMPAFGNQLTDDEIASALTFVRMSWGNDYGPVSPEEVAAVH